MGFVGVWLRHCGVGMWPAHVGGVLCWVQGGLKRCVS